MNTTVITVDAADYGVGTSDRVTFVDCTWHIDDQGTLHIKRENQRGNCAAFAAGTWVSVVEGNLFTEGSARVLLEAGDSA